MTPNTRHGFSAMCAGRGAEVERVLHHHESFAVAPRLDDVDASQHTPARAIRGGRSPGPRTTATTPGPRGLSTSAIPSAALATSTSWYGASHASWARWSIFDYLSLFLAQETASGARWYVLDSAEPSRLIPAYDAPIEAVHAAWVFDQQQPAVISRLDHDTRVSGVQSFLSARGFLSACTVPLTTVHRRLGSLHLAAVQPEAYSEEEVQFLSCVAEHIAMAVDNALRHAACQCEQARLRLLFESTNQVLAHVELREGLRVMTTRTRHVMRANVAVVVVPEADSGPVARRGPGLALETRGGSRRRS